MNNKFDPNGLYALAECVEGLLQLALCDGQQAAMKKYARVENDEGDDHQEGETSLATVNRARQWIGEADEEAESDERCALVASSGDEQDKNNNARHGDLEEDEDYTPRSPPSSKRRRAASSRASTNRKRTKFDQNWDAKYARLVTYVEQYGNALVTQKWVEPDGLRLGKWASNQRGRRAQGKLRPDRYERLDWIGFWDATYIARRKRWNTVPPPPDQEATRTE